MLRANKFNFGVKWSFTHKNRLLITHTKEMNVLKKKKGQENEASNQQQLDFVKSINALRDSFQLSIASQSPVDLTKSFVSCFGLENNRGNNSIFDFSLLPITRNRNKVERKSIFTKGTNTESLLSMVSGLNGNKTQNENKQSGGNQSKPSMGGAGAVHENQDSSSSSIHQIESKNEENTNKKLNYTEIIEELGNSLSKKDSSVEDEIFNEILHQLESTNNLEDENNLNQDEKDFFREPPVSNKTTTTTTTTPTSNGKGNLNHFFRSNNRRSMKHGKKQTQFHQSNLFAKRDKEGKWKVSQPSSDSSSSDESRKNEKKIQYQKETTSTGTQKQPIKRDYFAFLKRKETNITHNPIPNSTPNLPPNPSLNSTSDSAPNSTPNSTPNPNPNSIPNPNPTVNTTPNSTLNSTRNSIRNSIRNSTPNSTPNSTLNSAPNSTPNSTPNPTSNPTPNPPNSTPNSALNSKRNPNSNPILNSTSNSTSSNVRNSESEKGESVEFVIPVTSNENIPEAKEEDPSSNVVTSQIIGKIAGNFTRNLNQKQIPFKWLHQNSSSHNSKRMAARPRQHKQLESFIIPSHESQNLLPRSDDENRISKSKEIHLKQIKSAPQSPNKSSPPQNSKEMEMKSNSTQNTKQTQSEPQLSKDLPNKTDVPQFNIETLLTESNEDTNTQNQSKSQPSQVETSTAVPNEDTANQPKKNKPKRRYRKKKKVDLQNPLNSENSTQQTDSKSNEINTPSDKSQPVQNDEKLQASKQPIMEENQESTNSAVKTLESLSKNENPLNNLQNGKPVKFQNFKERTKPSSNGFQPKTFRLQNSKNGTSDKVTEQVTSQNGQTLGKNEKSTNFIDSRVHQKSPHESQNLLPRSGDDNKISKSKEIHLKQIKSAPQSPNKSSPPQNTKEMKSNSTQNTKQTQSGPQLSKDLPKTDVPQFNIETLLTESNEDTNNQNQSKSQPSQVETSPNEDTANQPKKNKPKRRYRKKKNVDPTTASNEVETSSSDTSQSTAKIEDKNITTSNNVNQENSAVSAQPKKSKKNTKRRKANNGATPEANSKITDLS